jgi:hypothetical protein
VSTPGEISGAIKKQSGIKVYLALCAFWHGSCVSLQPGLVKRSGELIANEMVNQVKNQGRLNFS